ncbi:hypothetical protein ACEPAF_4990 [Sanghuangporus sanghuang]
MNTDNGHFFRTETSLAEAEARKRKAERTKHLGEPLDLPAKPLDVIIRGKEIWIGQSDATIRRIDLESASTLQVYKGHTAPVASIALLEESSNTGNTELLLISGSWDKTVKIWNTKNKSIVSSTEAHSDFVKCIVSIPELKMLITSGSDKVVRFWDLSNPRSQRSLKNIGLVSAHSRPVQCITADVQSPTATTLYTADTMGIIKVWEIERSYGDSPNCRATQKEELIAHRTGINDMWFGQGQLWTASSDDTVLLTQRPPSGTVQQTPSKPVPPMSHPTAVKALLPLSLTDLGESLLLTGASDAIRLYDINEPSSPELLSTTDAHWFDIVSLRLWFRRRTTEDGKLSVEPWIVSASLDQTIRRWKLADLISPPKEPPKPVPKQEEKPASASQLTAEEEAELAELMDDD